MAKKYTLADGTEVFPGQPFETEVEVVDEDTRTVTSEAAKCPANFFELASAEDLARYGITVEDVPDQVPPDPPPELRK